MGFEASEGQRGLRALARELLGRESAAPKVRAAIASPAGYDERLYRQMAELGLHGVAIPEQYGGMGLGMVELALVLEEMGRHAYPGPFASSILLAAPLIEAGGSDEQKQRWLPRLGSGELVATVAFYEADPWPDPARLATTVADGRVTGTKRLVPWAGAAGLILVVGRGGAVAAIERSVDASTGANGSAGGADGVTIEPESTMDPGQRDAAVRFDGARGEPLPGGASAVEAMLTRAAIGAAAEMLGAARRSMEMSV